MATIKKPLNAIAYEVETMHSRISDLDVQIETLQNRKNEILASTLELDPYATWEMVEEPAPAPTVPPADPAPAA